MFVKPVPGRRVRCTVKGTFLPEEGAEVPDDSIFWRDRVRDGDVVKVEKKSKSTSTHHAESAKTKTPPAADAKESTQ